MTDDELDPLLREQIRGYHQPPAPPREALWARIQAARAEEQATAPVRAIRPAGRRLLPYVLGAAALVALAFGLGRISVQPVVVAIARPEQGPPTLAQRMAAGEYLGGVELFLTDFRAEARSGRPDSLAPERARRLLAATRLLLDSPSGQDARLKPLLNDLELILAEIAQLPAESDQDLDLITNNLDRQGTIARLRSSVTTGPSPDPQGEI
jgi:hypothetical protein